MNRLLLAAAGVLLAAGIGAAVLWWKYHSFVQLPLDLPEEGVVFVVEPGTTGQQLVARFAALGYTRADWRWRLLMRLEPRVYRAGEYRLEHGMRPREVLGRLASGEVVKHHVTLVEGWTFRQLVDFLAGVEALEQRFAADDPRQYAALLELMGVEHPEGWFLPETYQFTRGDSDVDILLRAYRAMQRALRAAWEQRAVGLPLESPYQLLTLASIVEKETALDAERADVAGVFVRRLQRGMRLQTDPTVIYGLGEGFDGDIRRRDLTTDTPYNTYTRHGLPPTPIAMPGLASLRAAAQPADGEALYFVADGQGGHTFSVTLEEHQRAVDQLLGRQ